MTNLKIKSGTSAINVPNGTRGSTDQAMTAVTVSNNSVYFGPLTKGTAIHVGGEGVNHQVTNNKIQYDGTSNFNCIKISLALTAYDNVDFNVCSYENTTLGNWEANTGDLAAWKGTGFGTNSQYAVPGL